MSATARLCIALLLSFALSACTHPQSYYPPQQLLDRITPLGIRAHMEYLADDLLEGRGTGTRGYQLAANYVRARFEQMGLLPAGESGTYFQVVHFRRQTPRPKQDSFEILRSDGKQTLTFEKDFVMEGNPAHELASVDAPMVFVGYGVTAPVRHYDDYAGIDAKGKIVLLVDAPPDFPSSDRATYSDEVTKQRNAAAHGAVGAVAIWAGAVTQNTPWERIVRFSHEPFMHWIDEHGTPNDYVPELKAGALINEKAGEVLLQGSGHTLADALASLKASKPMSFPLQGTASLKEACQFSELQSPNIAAIFQGSDPTLKNEYVVFTAHADHIGIGEPMNGDSIYNGAVDNASGTAALLEIAHAFAVTRDRPKRSLLFIVVTGEEAGLLGSDYYAHHPTIPIDQEVANIPKSQVFALFRLRQYGWHLALLRLQGHRRLRRRTFLAHASSRRCCSAHASRS